METFPVNIDTKKFLSDVDVIVYYLCAQRWLQFPQAKYDQIDISTFNS